VGRVEIDGIEYDKWRKIETGINTFTWNAEAKKYIYTNVITDAPTDAIGPLDMPAKIMSISGGEDLSAELAAQDELIADIKTAVAGKAGGGGAAPTMVTIKAYNNNGRNLSARCTAYENGALVDKLVTIAGLGPTSFSVVDQTILYVYGSQGFSCDARSSGLDCIAGEGDSTYAVYMINTALQSGETSMAIDWA
jgi:hypothetical protein